MDYSDAMQVVDSSNNVDRPLHQLHMLKWFCLQHLHKDGWYDGKITRINLAALIKRFTLKHLIKWALLHVFKYNHTGGRANRPDQLNDVWMIKLS